MHRYLFRYIAVSEKQNALCERSSETRLAWRKGSQVHEKSPGKFPGYIVSFEHFRIFRVFFFSLLVTVNNSVVVLVSYNGKTFPSFSVSMVLGF